MALDQDGDSVDEDPLPLYGRGFHPRLTVLRRLERVIAEGQYHILWRPQVEDLLSIRATAYQVPTPKIVQLPSADKVWRRLDWLLAWLLAW